MLTLGAVIHESGKKRLSPLSDATAGKADSRLFSYLLFKLIQVIFKTKFI